MRGSKFYLIVSFDLKKIKGGKSVLTFTYRKDVDLPTERPGVS